MIRDGELASAAVDRVYDVLIVGGGMAGITIADELVGSGLRICLLEAGGIHPDRRAQQRFAGESVGRDYYRLDRCRHRVLGGSSVRWGGFCRELDPIDFERREWIDASGWPISKADLDIPYARARRRLGLDAAGVDADRPGPSPWPPPGADRDLVLASVEIADRHDFGLEARRRFAGRDEVTVLLDADVVELEPGPGGSDVAAVRVVGRDGRSRSLRSRIFVLAAGGIENARLLLASRASRPAGLGNETDWVGRCFMDHLHRPFGHVVPRPGVPLPRELRLTRSGRARAQGVLTPSERALRAVGASSCSFTFDQAPSVLRTAPLLEVPPTAHAGYRRLRERSPRVAGRLRRYAFRTSGLPDRRRAWREARRLDARNPHELWTVYVRGEQTPNRASRVTLSSRLDANRMPLARLDWRVADDDIDALRTWSEALGRSLDGVGIGRYVGPAAGWEETLRGGPHHLGTTRMSHTPAGGVVDRDCRVHRMDNLYVAGGSIFATGGHANPSITILALSIRLADHLHRLLRPPAPRVRSAQAAPRAAS